MKGRAATGTRPRALTSIAARSCLSSSAARRRAASLPCRCCSCGGAPSPADASSAFSAASALPPFDRSAAAHAPRAKPIDSSSCIASDGASSAAAAAAAGRWPAASSASASSESYKGRAAWRARMAGSRARREASRSGRTRKSLPGPRSCVCACECSGEWRIYVAPLTSRWKPSAAMTSAAPSIGWMRSWYARPNTLSRRRCSSPGPAAAPSSSWRASSRVRDARRAGDTAPRAL